ncbi:unnamed protein product, partial [Discosporangium mesarthrocarpum]
MLSPPPSYLQTERLELIYFDAEQAFLHADIDEEVFVRLPPGCGDLSWYTGCAFERDREKATST